MRPNELRTAEQVHQEDMRDSEYRAEWERTALGRAVSLAVVRYRAQHELTQTGLAKLLGWTQPQVARLEDDDVQPSLQTLRHLADRLGMRFVITVEEGGRVRVEAA